MKTVVRLSTQEEANNFFYLTGFPMPECGCTRTNWDYRANTAYNISDVEFGNVNYWRAIHSKGIDQLEIVSYDDFMKQWNSRLKEVNVSFEVVC